MSNNQIDFRMERGFLISKEGSIVHNSTGNFTVHSQTQRIYYNFVKPHQALGGKTPAEKVGIKGKDKWKNLL